MLVLALDTTTRTGSVALMLANRLLEVYMGDPAEPHARRLPGALIDVVARHGYGLTDVDLFAVAAGPGSFTGLRIGIATMQGLALAAARPLVGVSALEALAVAAALGVGDGSHAIAAWMDAQRNEVFSAVYSIAVRAGRAGRPVTLDAPAAEPPGRVVDRWRREGRLPGLTAAGEGAARYADVLQQQDAALVTRILDGPLAIAPAIAMLGQSAHAGGGAHPPHAIRPIYVRRSDAELARDRRRSQA